MLRLRSGESVTDAKTSTAETSSGLAPEQLTRLVERAQSVRETQSRLREYFDTPAEYVDYFLEVRRHAIPRFLDDCVDAVLREDPTLVGFTCLFDQTMALSLHLFVVSTQVPDMPEALPYGVALVLVSLVLLMNSLSIILRMYLRGKKKW